MADQDAEDISQPMNATQSSVTAQSTMTAKKSEGGSKDCEWMFGDAATGVLGIHALAHLNPFRWSGGKTFEKALADLEAVQQHGSRPIVVKVPANDKHEKEFKTTQEAIEFLKSEEAAEGGTMRHHASGTMEHQVTGSQSMGQQVTGSQSMNHHSSEDILARKSTFTRTQEEAVAARRTAFEDLSAAQEAISMKALIELRGQREVSHSVQAVVKATICMVANIDDTVEVVPGAIPPETWPDAQAVLTKPAHFMNSLRRFPYAVDSGRLPEGNTEAASECMEGVQNDELANDNVAQHLHQWVMAAMRYNYYRNQFQTEGDDGGLSPAGGGRPVAFGMDNKREERAATYSAPPAADSAHEVHAGATLVESVPVPAVHSGTVAGTPGRASAGRNSLGTKSSPGKTPSSVTSRTSDSSYPQSSPVRPGGRGQVTNQRPGRGAGYGNAGRGGPTTPQATPPRVSYAPDTSSSMNRNRPSGGRLMQPRGSNVQLTAEDYRRKLDQIRRETREMKAMENNLKWNMNREEDKTQKIERKADQKNLMEHRQQESADMKQLQAEISKDRQINDLSEGKHFQEFKRVAKAEDHVEEAQRQHNEYCETKDHSDWQVEALKELNSVRQGIEIEDRVVHHQFIKEYRADQKDQEKEEQLSGLMLTKQLDLDNEIQAARQERDAALQSLEVVRSKQHVPVSPERHMGSRPSIAQPSKD